jgi:hypothetical protein
METDCAKKTQRKNKRSNMKLRESKNGNRRESGATEDRARGVADSSGAMAAKAEGGRQKDEISFPMVESQCRSTKVILADAGQVLRLTAKMDQLEAENALLKKRASRRLKLLKKRDAEIAHLKERARRRLILDEATIHAGAPQPDLATRMPMVSLIGCSQDQQIGERSVTRSFLSRWF